jgi:hypothetical protein
MATVKNTPPTGTKKPASQNSGTLFTKQNHIWMIIGGVLIALGCLLMIGGASKDPNQFLTKEVYSTIRITVAPIVILSGIGSLIFSIMRKSN